MNTIQTDDEKFVRSRVERTLVGAVENDEHLGGIREEGTEDYRKSDKKVLNNLYILSQTRLQWTADRNLVTSRMHELLRS